MLIAALSLFFIGLLITKPASASSIPTGSWTVSYYNNKSLQGSPVNTAVIPAQKQGSLQENYGLNAPADKVNKDGFSARYVSNQHLPAGDYVLRAFADDGVKVLVDGKEVLNGWEIGSYKGNSVKIHISNINGNDLHKVEVQYFDNAAYAKFAIQFDPYSDQLTSGWMGEIYPDKTLTPVSGQPVVVLGGKDALHPINQLNFNWGTGSPSVMMPKDNFSAVFTKNAYFDTSAVYQFDANADDGIRVYVDNKPVIDSWKNSAFGLRTGQIFIPKGTHQLRVEYYESGGAAALKLNMVSLPTFSGSGTSIHYNWGAGSPEAGLPSDHFYSHFDQSSNFDGKEYFIQTFFDDRDKVTLDGKPVINRTSNGAWYTDQAILGKLTGYHNIETTGYETTGYANAFSDIAPFGSWVTYYYNNTNLTGKPVNGQIVSPQSDGSLAVNNGSQSPLPGVKSTGYSAKYVTYKRINAGDYLLQTQMNDGVRVKIDGKTVMDNWHIGANHTSTVEVHIDNSNNNDIHLLEVDSFDASGDGALKMTMQPFNALSSSGWTGEVYPDETLTSVPGKPVVILNQSSTSATNYSLSYKWGTGSPAQSIPADHFSAVFNRKITITSPSHYDLKVQADDGVRVYVDNQKVIDSWNPSAMGLRDAGLMLQSGVHNIKVEYYEHTGAAGIDLSLIKVPTFYGSGTSIHYNWGTGAPASGFPSDNFYSSFDQSKTFDGQEYFIQTFFDDRDTVTLDGKPVIDRTKNGAWYIDRAILGKLSGYHKILTTGYDASGYATAYSDIAPFGSWVTYYYNNVDLKGKPVNGQIIKGSENNSLSVNNGIKAPMSKVNADQFSAKYVTYERLPAGNYDLLLNADDGVRVLLDGKVIYDHWNSSTGGTVTKKVSIANTGNGNIHLVEIQHNDKTGPSNLNVQFIPTNVWTATYYNYPKGGTPSVSGTPTASQFLSFPLDKYLLDNPGSKSPAAGVSATNYAAKYTAVKYLPAGDYVFRGRADGGIKVLLDGQPIINRWSSSSYTENAVKVHVSNTNRSPYHKVEVDYFNDNDSNAIAYLRIEKYSDELNANDWVAEFHPNTTFSGNGIIKGGRMALDHIPSLNLDWGNGSPDPTIPSSNFSAYFHKYVNITQAGTYQFVVRTDGAFKLYIDGSLKMNHWSTTSNNSPVYQNVTLQRGSHMITLVYLHKTGSADVNLNFALGKTSMYYTTNYSVSLNNALNKEMQLSPQTDQHPYSLNGYIAKDALVKNSSGNWVVKSNNWNLRACASTDDSKCPVLHTLQQGEWVTVNGSVAADGLTWDKVNYVMDSWIDATASQVKYYLDPSNFSKGSSEYFQFLKLDQSADVSVDEVNSKILYNKGILKGQGAAFIKAGQLYNMNEIYLISHALLETGNGTSQLATGVCYDPGNQSIVSSCSSTTHAKKVYNMYGIGAFDSEPLLGGAQTAYANGWFTPGAAIIGGANFIDSNYIGQGQDTLYKMRWNPAALASSGGASHQYATDIGWAVKQTQSMSNLYDLLSTYTNVYDIPNY